MIGILTHCNFGIKTAATAVTTAAAAAAAATTTTTEKSIPQHLNRPHILSGGNVKMFGLLVWPLFVGFELTITFLERRTRRTVLWSQGTRSTLETFALKADKEVQRITLSWTSGEVHGTDCVRAVPIMLPRTAPQRMYTYVKYRRIAGPFHSSCASIYRHNTNICVEMHTARCQFRYARYKVWL